MALTELNAISVAQLIVYIPLLIIAIFLAIRHGFSRSAGWVSLVLLCVIRFAGAALQLATINAPTNVGLYIAAFTLQNISLSPLLLATLGLIARVVAVLDEVDPVNAGKRKFLLRPQVLRLTGLLVLVGLILSAVGGSQLSKSIASISSGSSATYTVPTVSVAGLVLMIAGFGIAILATLQLATIELHKIPHGERRVVGALAAAIPFIAVRVVFSAMSIFANDSNFRPFSGSARYPNYYLGMSVIVEIVVIIIFEAVGLTLSRRVVVGQKRGGRGNGQRTGDVPMGDYAAARV